METSQNWSTSKYSSTYFGCNKAHLTNNCILYHSVINFLGDIEGKSVLDLGCGEGDFCRLVKSKNALRVIGIDISPSMISRAQEGNIASAECEYRLGDIRSLGSIGQFDYITANLVLIWAESVDDLTTICCEIHKNLKSGGRFVGTFINSSVKADWGTTLEKYGLHYYSVLTSTSDDAKPKKFKGIISRGSNEEPFQAIINLLSPEEIETAFRNGGFSSFILSEPSTSEETINSYPKGFWDLYFKKPCHMCVIADK